MLNRVTLDVFKLEDIVFVVEEEEEEEKFLLDLEDEMNRQVLAEKRIEKFRKLKSES